MDFDGFLERTNKSKADLLREIGLDPKSSLLSAYIAGLSMPSYDMCIKLLQCGMTIEELFGKNIWEIVKGNELDASRIQNVTDEYCVEFVKRG